MAALDILEIALFVLALLAIQLLIVRKFKDWEFWQEISPERIIKNIERKIVRMNDLINFVEHWSKNKGLDQSEPSKQFLKVIEETGELAQGIAKGRKNDTEDAFGDVLVTLIILNQQLRERGEIEANLEDCLRIAYAEIVDRKGQMKDGVFVKEEDL